MQTEGRTAIKGYCEPELLERAKKQARAEFRTVSQLVVLAVTQYLDRAAKGKRSH